MLLLLDNYLSLDASTHRLGFVTYELGVVYPNYDFVD